MERIASLMSKAGAAIVGTGVFFNTFFYTVEPGYRAVIFDKAFGGVKDTVVGEGMHLYFPFVQVPTCSLV